MRALKWIVCIGLCFAFGAGTVVQGGDIAHQYGIEFRGGYGLYMNNSDPDSYAENFEGLSASGYSQSEYNESTGAISGGISLLYKSKEYFAWHIGLNVLSTDSATAIAVNPGSDDQVGRVFFNTVELFFTANYYWNLSPRFNVQIGAGPAFYLASLDREALGGSDIRYGESFYGAHGRSFGFLGTLGAELYLSDAISFKFGGGFRYALIDRFKYFIETQGLDGSVLKTGNMVYWAGTSDTFEVDFTGAFVEVGFRVYFEPEAAWKNHD